MKIIFIIYFTLTTTLFASLKVDTTYATLGAIAKEVGGDLIQVTVLGSAKYDPHFIVPKPSLLAKLHSADLLIINGGGLELGWLPPLVDNANNKKIKNQAEGFLDISHSIVMIDKPQNISRAFGDIHAEGNPHYIMNPHNVLIIAEVIMQRLALLDLSHAQKYKQNFQEFKKRWKEFLRKYDKDMQSCKGKEVVQYHALYNYFLRCYGLKSVANIEPLPGISPSSKHTMKLIKLIRESKVNILLQDVYHEKKTARFIATKTEAKVRIVPHELGSVKGTETLEKFYNMLGNRICK